MGCGGSKAAEGGQQPQPKPSQNAQKETGQSSSEESNKVTTTQENSDGSQEVNAPAEQPETEPGTEPASQTQEFSELELTALKHHNDYRALHGTTALTLSRELCVMAQGWADQLAAKKQFEHSKDRKTADGQPVGENLYMSSSSAPDVSGDGATESWYNEIKDYDYDKPGFSMETGHFTQVVWRDTSTLGVGAATYKNGDWYNIVVVANYGPAGNFQGRFEENVPKPL